MARAPAVQEIEDLPEIDRLDGFPHPRMTERLYGHEAAERTLAEAFESGRLHHGWLNAGAEGIVKASLA
jgi:DNA polymerase-3 subunit delta'